MYEQLYVDCCGFTTMHLIESTNGSVKFRGKFQEANAVNKNKRTYSYDVLARNVDSLYETITARGLYGELDHPTDSIIHLANASHVVTKLWWEGNALMGEAEVLPTPSGMILKKFIESGCRIGISSRGVGNGQTNNEGVLVISENFKLITFDAVADPSTYQAFQQKVTGKQEAFEARPVSNPIISKHRDRLNEKAFVPFFATTLEKMKQEHIQKIRSK